MHLLGKNYQDIVDLSYPSIGCKQVGLLLNVPPREGINQSCLVWDICILNQCILSFKLLLCNVSCFNCL